MAYTKIEGHPNLFRNTESQSIVNTNSEEYSRYLSTLKIKQKDKTKVEVLERDLNDIKEEINQVKEMLQKLLNSCKG
jgi:predicted ribosome quality control (RQC) complex YloA/Tae2 family protein